METKRAGIDKIVMEFIGKDISNVKLLDKLMDDMDVDYKLSTETFGREMEKNKNEILYILSLSSLLESQINSVVKIKATELGSRNLIVWTENQNVPIIQKLRILRFLEIIDEDEYKQIVELFKVRNEIAHRDLRKGGQDPFRFINVDNLKIKNPEEKKTAKLFKFAYTISTFNYRLELAYKIISKRIK